MVLMDAPLVLGIETSCDETGIGIVRGRQLLSNTIASSMDEHARYGGVVPEVAARAHLEALQPSIDAALAEAGVTLADLDAVAVTSGPGLAGALMVGVGAAKGLAVALDKPLYAVNHLVGHIAADILDDDGLPVRVTEAALSPRDDLDARLEEHGARRYDATSVSAAMIALAAARALDADRTLAGPEPLYLRSPDVVAAHAPKRVS